MDHRKCGFRQCANVQTSSEAMTLDEFPARRLESVGPALHDQFLTIAWFLHRGKSTFTLREIHNLTKRGWLAESYRHSLTV